jgi:hypothetical protein
MNFCVVPSAASVLLLCTRQQQSSPPDQPVNLEGLLLVLLVLLLVFLLVFLLLCCVPQLLVHACACFAWRAALLSPTWSYASMPSVSSSTCKVEDKSTGQRLHAACMCSCWWCDLQVYVSSTVAYPVGCCVFCYHGTMRQPSFAALHAPHQVLVACWVSCCSTSCNLLLSQLVAPANTANNCTARCNCLQEQHAPCGTPCHPHLHASVV